MVVPLSGPPEQRSQCVRAASARQRHVVTVPRVHARACACVRHPVRPPPAQAPSSLQARRSQRPPQRARSPPGSARPPELRGVFTWQGLYVNAGTQGWRRGRPLGAKPAPRSKGTQCDRPTNSSPAMQPVPAAVMAWRQTWSCTERRCERGSVVLRLTACTSTRTMHTYMQATPANART